jgi:hypothetical protein
MGVALLNCQVDTFEDVHRTLLGIDGDMKVANF